VRVLGALALVDDGEVCYLHTNVYRYIDSGSVSTSERQDEEQMQWEMGNRDTSGEDHTHRVPTQRGGPRRRPISGWGGGGHTEHTQTHKTYCAPGAVQRVRVLGALALVDDGEVYTYRQHKVCIQITYVYVCIYIYTNIYIYICL